ncbi:hypothetical protein GCM10010472_40390 [Pseudonocardia halophobica]|uniref:DUF3071 domain-containing protein n=1 Tax=Pseudonocardia halophobica TaxID=29401 RepID=A0A9W6P0B5_9PSEU|nr:septation protein SepH [Pseudonocardia halophobica]GLL15447.1 hypothetical protein GCM10017577_65980 [Pseudonocardia halophobica]
MRSLRVVGITEDGSVVLEDSARRERFTVPADEQLRAAARGDLTRLGQIAIELESQLRPREIQARIRAGASVEQVASAAGVPVQKIERFAYPVLLERTRTAELAQAAHPVRDDGPDVRTLAETVAHTFGLRGQDPGADWDSWKGEDGKWVVALGWRSGRSDIRAHWVFQPGAHGGTVTALDDHARDLVEGRPQQPLRPVGPVIDMARPDDAAAEVAAEEVVPAAVNGDARRIAPEQRRGSLPGRREPVRGATRTEVSSELAGPPTHPAARSTDTRATDTRTSDVGRSGIDSSAGRDGAERVNGHEVPGREAAASGPAPVPAASISGSGSAPVGGGSEPVEAVQDEAPAVAEVATPAAEKTEVDRPAAVPEGSAPRDIEPKDEAATNDAPEKIAEPETADPKIAESTDGGSKDGGSEDGGSEDAVEAAGSSGGSTDAAEAAGRDTASKNARTPARTERTRSGAAAKTTPAKPAGAAAEKVSDAAPTEAESAAAPTGDARPAGDQPAPAKRTKKGKPVMPSWDEVLLGVRGR